MSAKRSAPHNYPTHPITDLEPAIGNEPLGTQEVPRFTAPVRIHVHNVRKRYADTDGISIKGIIDGLVNFKILADDSPAFVKEITQTQELGQPEQTIITITDEL
jgi:hypothetical protein